MSFREALYLGWLATLVLQAGWAYKIWAARHARRYPAVFAYFLFSVVSGSFTIALEFSRLSVGGVILGPIAYFVFRPLTWVLFFAVVHELYNIMARKYQGLRRVGQLVFYGALGSVLAFLALAVLSNPYSSPNINHYYRLWMIQEQSVYLATAFAVMAVLIVSRFFALPMSRNLRIVLGSLGLYFIVMGGMILLRSQLGPQWSLALDAAGLVLYCLCLAIGAVAYSSAGAQVVDDPRLTRSAEHLAALGVAPTRLEDVNMQLARVLAK